MKYSEMVKITCFNSVQNFFCSFVDTGFSSWFVFRFFCCCFFLLFLVNTVGLFSKLEYKLGFEFFCDRCVVVLHLGL